MITFTRHVFATLTYGDRSADSESVWRKTSKDYNRYIQRIRRLHNCPVQYLRTVEAHKDGYPHVHSLLQWPDARIRVSNTRYFDRELYSQWRKLWESGLSDFQVPRRNSDSVRYILKYITKNTTTKTVWKKLFVNPAEKTQNMQLEESGHPTKCIPVLDACLRQLDSQSDLSTVSKTHLYGVKLCSWSRDFDFSPFFINSKQLSTDNYEIALS